MAKEVQKLRLEARAEIEEIVEKIKVDYNDIAAAAARRRHFG